MTPYWLLFATTAFMALVRLRLDSISQGQEKWTAEWFFFFTVLTLMIGLREEVGGDWDNYRTKVEAAVGQPLTEVFDSIEIGYSMLNWFGANVFGGMYSVNVICAALFSWGLLSFCRTQPRPWLALVVAIPYLVTVVAMGYSRQAVAIGISMLGLVALSRGKMSHFVLWIAFAATFHRSAVILLPLAGLGSSQNRWIKILIGLIASAMLYGLVVHETVDEYVTVYVSSGIDSSGAAIRVAMNALPALVFLYFRKRFAMPPTQMKFWTYMSLSALAFIPLLALSSSSTAVDRIALYWIPLQLFVWNRIPGALTSSPQSKARFAQIVAAYSALVLLVWLFFADNAYSWIPYRFYPLEGM